MIATKMSPRLCFSVLGLLLAIASLVQISVRGQVISLRHPESDQRFAQLRNNSRLITNHHRRARYTARPGNVIVHFDRNHDIQQLKYVLQDGRLATLFQRSSDPANSRTPIAVPFQPSAPATARAAEVTANRTQPMPTTNNQTEDANNDQSIDIVDDKLRGISRLIGDHITVPLQSEHSSPNDPLLTPTNPISEDEKLEIIATVAVDSLQAGAQIGAGRLRKAGQFLEKLKGKVKQKLHELPGIIDTQLRSKSSVGQVYLDNVGDEFILVNAKQIGNQQVVIQNSQQHRVGPISQKVLARPLMSKQILIINGE